MIYTYRRGVAAVSNKAQQEKRPRHNVSELVKESNPLVYV